MPKMDLSSQILSDIIVHMKYAKYLAKKERRENWKEIVTRDKIMLGEKFPALQDEIEGAFKYVYARQVLPSMRAMQFAGKAVHINNVRLYNCCYMPMNHIDSFSELMFLLLAGTGVGYSVQRHHIDELPEITRPTKTFRYLISDSIEGWADAVKVLIKAYFAHKPLPEFDFDSIRSKGTPLVTSGGKAPGPEPLKDCLHNIQKILDRKASGDQLSSLEVHDINCFIAEAVRAGGIRRSAMIALFDLKDDEMLTCKFGDWYIANPQRGRANNSVVILRHKVKKKDFLELWKKIEMSGSGEPGFFFTNDKEWGLNPCVSGDTVLDVKIDNKYERISIRDLATYFEDTVAPQVDIKTMSSDGKVCFKPLTAVAKTKKNAKLVRVTDTVSGKKLVCTPEHKICTKNRGWIEAQLLESNDELVIV